MKKIKNISFSNHIQKNYLKFKSIKDIKKKYQKIKEEIILNLDTPKNVLHSLSDKFEFSFKMNDLKKFKKFQTVVIIVMGV